jgi:chaperone required for assembly of F1-ATPase
MKRFYKMVSIGETPKGFSILLDGKPVKTQSRHLLETSHRDLANAVLHEWMGQGDKILPATMPLMQILSTKIDRVSEQRETMTESVIKYLDTDLLCYRAVQPPELARRQQDAWDPWLVWFEKKFGATLATTTDLKALNQPAKAHEAVRDHIEDMDDDHFTILQIVTPLCGSVVLALAFVDRAATPEDVFAASHVEETYKSELYNEQKHGPDLLQEKKDREAVIDLEAAAKFLDFFS